MQTAHRARSEDQKLARRHAILKAADDCLAEHGFELLAMAGLAKAAGVAKGTLYLYFQTREEVFLALSEEKIETWAERLRAELKPGMPTEDFCRAFLNSARADDNLLKILVRLDTAIEHNVSIDALVRSKRAMRNTMGRIAADIAAALDLSADGAMEALTGLAPLLIGTSQTDQGPSFAEEALPDDVRAFMATFDSERTFLTNAARIVDAIRTNPLN